MKLANCQLLRGLDSGDGDDSGGSTDLNSAKGREIISHVGLSERCECHVGM